MVSYNPQWLLQQQHVDVILRSYNNRVITLSQAQFKQWLDRCSLKLRGDYIHDSVNGEVIAAVMIKAQ